MRSRLPCPNNTITFHLLRKKSGYELKGLTKIQTVGVCALVVSSSRPTIERISGRKMATIVSRDEEGNAHNRHIDL
jgi:hypothetical protein